MDKNELVSKYVTFCGKVYDKVSSFWEGKHERTPETVKKSQVRGTWIVSLFIAFAILGAIIDDEEDVDSSNDETAETARSESRSSVPTTDVSKLGKPKSFREIAVDKWKVKLLGDDTFHLDVDNGVAFFHSGIGKKVISVDDDGVIIGQQSAISGEWQVAYVKTDDTGYVDGSDLKRGVYVRKGTYRYGSADGAVRTIPAFEKITREKDLKIFMAMYEAEKDRIKAPAED